MVRSGRANPRIEGAAANSALGDKLNMYLRQAEKYGAAGKKIL